MYIFARSDGFDKAYIVIDILDLKDFICRSDRPYLFLLSQLQLFELLPKVGLLELGLCRCNSTFEVSQQSGLYEYIIQCYQQCVLYIKTGIMRILCNKYAMVSAK